MLRASPRRFRLLRRGGTALCMLALTASCATYSERSESARAAVSAGDLEQGLADYNMLLEVKSEEEEPDKLAKDGALLMLERATILQALGLWKWSARDFQRADKELDYLDLAKDAGGQIGKYIYSDSATKYVSTPTEKLSLNAMNLVNYLSLGDLDGARVEAKRFTVMRKYLRDFDPDHAHGAFGSVLSGFVFERLGDASAALRYYDEALDEHDLPFLAGAIERLGSQSSYRGEHLDRYLQGSMTAEAASSSGEASSEAEGREAASSAAAELLVVIKTGRVPSKIPERLPIGTAIGLAHLYITGDASVLENTAFKVVTFPSMTPTPEHFEEAMWSIDQRPMAMNRVSELGEAIQREHDELVPRIVGASISRMIARAIGAAGADAGARAAVGGAGGEVLGLLAGLAVEGTLVALDRPDTRSWTLLPERVWMGRARLPAGEHRVELQVRGPGGDQTVRRDVDLAPGGFVVLDLTTLR